MNLPQVEKENIEMKKNRPINMKRIISGNDEHKKEYTYWRPR